MENEGNHLGFILQDKPSTCRIHASLFFRTAMGQSGFQRFYDGFQASGKETVDLPAFA